MTIYVEYVLINNFIIDLLILKNTFLITKIQYKKWRVILCSLLGACISLIYPLIPTHKVILTLLKIAVGILLILVANSYKSVRFFLYNFFIFLMLTFLYGGIIIGFSYIFNFDYTNEYFVAVIAIPIYFISLFIKKIFNVIYKRKNIARNIYKCKLYCGKITLDCNGFFDTGNCLTYQNKMIIVADKITALKIINFNDFFSKKVKYIEYNTTLGSGKMALFSIDKIVVYFEKKEHTFCDVMLGISKEKVGSNFDIILNQNMGEIENEKVDREIKKVL